MHSFSCPLISLELEFLEHLDEVLSKYRFGKQIRNVHCFELSELLAFDDSAVEQDYFGLVWYLVVNQTLLELINAGAFRL